MLDSVTLCFSKILPPQDLWESIIDPNKFRFGGTLGIQFRRTINLVMIQGQGGKLMVRRQSGEGDDAMPSGG